MEQYGHMEEVYGPSDKKSSPLVRILKIFIALVLLLLIGFIIFRIWIMESHPAAMEELSFNETLRAHYSEVGRDMKVYTQDIRIPYDDSDEGYFFAHSLFLIPDADQVQITVRFNRSTVKKMQELYGDAVADENSFSYRLSDSQGNVYLPSDTEKDSRFLYRYRKLTFDGVAFPLPSEVVLTEKEDGTKEGGFYMTVDIMLEGISEPIGRIPIYETHMVAKDKQKRNQLYLYDVDSYSVTGEEWPRD